jgi:hypothetical protein
MTLTFERDRNLSLDVWKMFGKQNGEKLPPASKHRWSEEGIAPNGDKWNLDPSDVMRIKYSPVDPEGRDFKTLYDEFKRLEGNKEYQRDERLIERLRSYAFGGRNEHAYAESAEEARLLCSALHLGDAGQPSYQELLTAAGFELGSREHQFCYKPDDYETWKYPTKSGSFTVVIRDPVWDDLQHGNIHCSYSGNRAARWNNVFSIDNDIRGHNDKTYRGYIFWPDTTSDLRKVAALHIIEVIRLRSAREGVQIKVPLGGPIPAGYR